MAFWFGEEADPLDDDRFIDPDRWGELTWDDWAALTGEDWSVLYEIFADDPEALAALDEHYEEMHA